MATVIYPTELAEDGSVILASDDLLELDQLFNSEWERLAKHEREEIERAVAEEGQQFAAFEEPAKTYQRFDARIKARQERSLVMFLPGGQKLAVESFTEAAKHHELMQQSATGFKFQIRRGDVRVSLRVQRGRYNEIEIETAPAES